MTDDPVSDVATRLADPGAAHLPVDELLQLAVSAVAEAMGTDVASVYVADPAAGVLVLAATHGLARAAVGFVTLKVGEGVSGQAAAHSRPIAAADVSTDAAFTVIPGFDQSRFRSILAVPVLAGEQVVGVLNVQTVATHLYAPDERHQLTAIAELFTGLVIRLLSDGLLSLRGPSLLSNLGGLAAMTGGPVEVCEAVLRELALMLPSSCCAILLATGDSDGADGGDRADGAAATQVVGAPDPELQAAMAAALDSGRTVVGAPDVMALALPGRDGLWGALGARRTGVVTASWSGTAAEAYLRQVAEQLGQVLETVVGRSRAARRRGDLHSPHYTRLVQFVLADGGVVPLVTEVAQLCGTDVAVFDGFGTLVAGTVPDAAVTDVALEPAGQHLGRMLAGRSLDAEPVLATAAHVIALEMAKRRAGHEAEARLRGDVLDLLLRENEATRQEAVARASLVGLDLTRTHRPIFVVIPAGRPDSGPWLDIRSRGLAELVHDELGPPPTCVVFQRPRGLLVLVDSSIEGTDSTDGTDSHAAHAERLAKRLRDLVRVDRPGIGTAGPVTWPYGFAAGVRRAQLSAELAVLLGADVPMDSAGIGVYGLLLELDEQSLRSYVDDQLGALLEQDLRSGADLVRTLEAYHRSGERLRPTADALFVHINTVKYRLSRIEALTDGRFSTTSGRFQLNLALYGLRLLEPRRPSLLVDETSGESLSGLDSVLASGRLE